MTLVLCNWRWCWSLQAIALHHIGQGWFAANTARAVDESIVTHKCLANWTWLKAQQVYVSFRQKQNYQKNHALFISIKSLSTGACANSIAEKTNHSPADLLTGFACTRNTWNVLGLLCPQKTQSCWLFLQSEVSGAIFIQFLFFQIKSTRQNSRGTNHAKLWPWSLHPNALHHIAQGWFAANIACAVDRSILVHECLANWTWLKEQRLYVPFRQKN